LSSTHTRCLRHRSLFRLLNIHFTSSMLLGTCCACLQPVESPLQFVELYKESDYNITTIARRIYNGMHSAADFTIGATVDALSAAGMWDSTVLVVAGDNGGTFEHGFPVPGSSNVRETACFTGRIKFNCAASLFISAIVRSYAANVYNSLGSHCPALSHLFSHSVDPARCALPHFGPPPPTPHPPTHPSLF